MKVGDIVRWSPISSHSRIGIILSLCNLQDLYYVCFPCGDYEIEGHYLELISESR